MSLARSPFALTGRVAALLAAAALLAGCVASGSQATPGSPAPSGSGSPSNSAFYLRAWQSQALAPQFTFGSLPGVTISDGKFYDGMVAIPMIYPGPIYVGLSTRTITAQDIDSIVAEARKDGLLGAVSDFSSPMPGAVTAHITMIVGGVTYDIIGPLSADAHTTTSKPGTADAFDAFWNKISNLSAWFGSSLGPSVSYDPERLAVLTTAPATGGAGIEPNQKPWPLAATFAKLGTPAGSATDRCAVVSGADLALLLPAVKAGNGLTQFVDSSGVKKSLQTRVLLPGEPSPCG
jgi:hypothetical protein